MSFTLRSICSACDLFWGLTQCDRDYDTIFPHTKWEGRWLYVSTRLPAFLELNFFTRLLHLLSAHQALLLCSQALEEKAPSRSDFVTYFSFILPFKALGLSQLLLSPPTGQRKAAVCSRLTRSGSQAGSCTKLHIWPDKGLMAVSTNTLKSQKWSLICVVRDLVLKYLPIHIIAHS